jgi:thymidylate synthase (FAD)
MKIVPASWSWEHKPENALERLERIARTCYKSEDRIGPGTAEAMCRTLRVKRHWPMFDHVHASVRFITNRGVSHELVRHRIAAYAQESSRYCNYAKGKFGRQLTFIEPVFFPEIVVPVPDGTLAEVAWRKRNLWQKAMQHAENTYFDLIDLGAKPEEARDVMPTALKTEIVATFAFSEWRHVFGQRASWKAHPQMQEVMVPVLDGFRQEWPAVFEDVVYEARSE